MNKRLPTNSIANELSGSSVFFQSPNKAESPQEYPAPKTEQIIESKPEETMTPRHHETMTARRETVKEPSDPAQRQDVTSEDMTAATLETIRKTVRQIGKEAATHRFTTEEKNVLTDIVYTYTRQGYKTSENEVTRIAINWLILDYQERGEQSVLARMLEALHK